MDTAPNNSLTAPPPPSSVKVRTMKSDLASMAKSGGGMPTFENVKVAPVAARVNGKGNPLALLIAVLVLAALAAAGWFAYTKFFANGQAQQPQQPLPQVQQPAPQSAIPSGSVPVLKLNASSS
jgi:hypothetical protein